MMAFGELCSTQQAALGAPHHRLLRKTTTSSTLYSMNTEIRAQIQASWKIIGSLFSIADFEAHLF